VAFAEEKSWALSMVVQIFWHLTRTLIQIDLAAHERAGQLRYRGELDFLIAGIRDRQQSL
jgi:hypothetical protein